MTATVTRRPCHSAPWQALLSEARHTDTADSRAVGFPQRPGGDRDVEFAPSAAAKQRSVRVERMRRPRAVASRATPR